MANMEIRYESFAEKKLKEIKSKIRRKTKIFGGLLSAGLLLSVFLVVFSFFIKSSGFLIAGFSSVMFFLALSVLLYSSVVNSSEIAPLQSGIEGEASFASVLRKVVPPYHTIIYNYSTPRGDIDAIVVGKTGVYVFEVKNVVGFLTTENNEWKRYKISSRGNVYSVKANNYEMQAKRNADYIRRLLGFQSGISVDYYVIFTNPNLVIDDKLKNGKMFYLQDFAVNFKWHKEYLTDEQVEHIIRVLNLSASQGRA